MVALKRTVEAFNKKRKLVLGRASFRFEHCADPPRHTVDEICELSLRNPLPFLFESGSQLAETRKLGCPSVN